MIDEDEYYPYDEIILLPFYTPYVNPQPFEVIIKKSIKAITYYDYEVIKEIISEKESESKSKSDSEYNDDDEDEGYSLLVKISLNFMLLLFLI